MITPMTSPLFIIGTILSISGLVIGCSYAFRWSDNPTPKFVIPVFVSLVMIGILLIGVDGFQELDQQNKQEKIVSDNIEMMSCSQLHDALLHNTINGTIHIQRATERYVAGCETK